MGKSVGPTKNLLLSLAWEGKNAGHFYFFIPLSYCQIYFLRQNWKISSVKGAREKFVLYAEMVYTSVETFKLIEFV